MCSLGKFPKVPKQGVVNVCEIEGKIHSAPVEVAKLENFTTTVLNHPTVSITRETDHCVLSETNRVFLPVEDTLLKQLVSTWYEEGPFEALKVVSEVSSVIPLKKLASIVLTCIHTIKKAANKFYPRLKERGPHLISLVSQTRDWPLSPVRCINWHPIITKLAVSTWDDSIRVYSAGSSLVPVIKCPTQNNISCIVWRPYSASELAVGCQSGILIWTIDPNSVVARPSMSCAKVLKKFGHAPITAISWFPSGNSLLSCSAADSTMYIWDVEMEESVPLRRFGGGGVCFTSWSPDGGKLLSTTAGQVFRVWDTNKWTADIWTTSLGRVQTACWSPCGSILLFATTDEPFIYSVPFSTAGSVFKADDLKAAVRVIDLNVVDGGFDVSSEEESGRVGGLVNSICWDGKGHHLAVMFKHCPIIAVFRTDLKISFNVTPCCFINGMPGETPSTMEFQLNFDEGALLTIAWSTGRIQYFPFVYTDLEDLDQSYVANNIGLVKQAFPYYNEW